MNLSYQDSPRLGISIHVNASCTVLFWSSDGEYVWRVCEHILFVSEGVSRILTAFGSRARVGKALRGATFYLC